MSDEEQALFPRFLPVRFSDCVERVLRVCLLKLCESRINTVELSNHQVPVLCIVWVCEFESWRDGLHVTAGIRNVYTNTRERLEGLITDRCCSIERTFH